MKMINHLLILVQWAKGGSHETGELQCQRPSVAWRLGKSWQSVAVGAASNTALKAMAKARHQATMVSRRWDRSEEAQ